MSAERVDLLDQARKHFIYKDGKRIGLVDDDHPLGYTYDLALQDLLWALLVPNWGGPEASLARAVDRRDPSWWAELERTLTAHGYEVRYERRDEDT